MARVTRSLGNIAIVLVSLIVALIAAEGVLRVLPTGLAQSYGGDRGFFSIYDQKLGWRAKPLVHSLHTERGFSVDVSQNSLGLRGPESIGPIRSNDKYRVLVLGDSYVWGYGADQKDLFQNADIHNRDDVEMINFGVSGYGTDQELLWYRDLGTKFDVDRVVLVITLYNDVSNNLAPVAYRYAKPYFELNNDGNLTLHDDHIADDALRAFGNRMLTHSRLAGLLNTVLLNLQYAALNKSNAKEGLAEAKGNILLPNDMTDSDAYGIDLTVAILAQLRKEVTQRGADLLVTYVPYKPHILRDVPDNHPFAQVFIEKLDALGIENFDPYLAFLGAARSGATLFNLRDNHFNASGHRVFAKALAAHLGAKH